MLKAYSLVNIVALFLKHSCPFSEAYEVLVRYLKSKLQIFFKVYVPSSLRFYYIKNATTSEGPAMKACQGVLQQAMKTKGIAYSAWLITVPPLVAELMLSN